MFHICLHILQFAQKIKHLLMQFVDKPNVHLLITSWNTIVLNGLFQSFLLGKESESGHGYSLQMCECNDSSAPFLYRAYFSSNKLYVGTSVILYRGRDWSSCSVSLDLLSYFFDLGDFPFLGISLFPHNCTKGTGNTDSKRRQGVIFIYMTTLF